MRGSEFIYDSVDVLYYNLNKVSLSRGVSYIVYPKWLKNKESNNESVALNILYVPHNTEKIRHAYKSK